MEYGRKHETFAALQLSEVPFQGETVSQAGVESVTHTTDETFCQSLSFSKAAASGCLSVEQALKEAAEVAQASIELNKALSRADGKLPHIAHATS